MIPGTMTSPHPPRRLLLIAGATVAPALAARLSRPALATRPAVGEVDTVSGLAQANHPGEASRPLRPTAPVLMDDILSTGAGSRLACRLEGGMVLRLGELATLRIDALTLRGPGARIALRSFGGALLFDRTETAAARRATASAAGEGTIPRPPTTLELPWARIGVRGTKFFAGVVDGTNAVFVERGEVLVEAPGSAHAPATLGPGDGVDLPDPGSPTAGAAALTVRRWGAARIARALALVA
jgi:hypothetical protein